MNRFIAFVSSIILAVSLIACGLVPEDGERGPPGKDGSGLIRVLACVGDSTTIPKFSLVHEVDVFADGSVFAACTVAGGNFQVTGVTFFKHDMIGAPGGDCFAFGDLDTSSRGYWTFVANPVTRTSRVTYNDPGSSNDGKVTVINCSIY